MKLISFSLLLSHYAHHTHAHMHTQVLSGDSIVIRGQPRNGPPPEKTLVLSNIIAPKIGRRVKDGEITKEEASNENYHWHEEGELPPPPSP